MYKKSNYIIGNFGLPNQGKTYLTTKVLIPQIPRYFIFDVNEEYGDKIKGCIQCKSFDALVDYVQKMKNPVTDYFKIAYSGFSNTEKAYEEDVENLLELLQVFGNLTIIVEESTLFQNSNKIPFQLFNIVERGRHKDISLIIIARRPTNSNRRITGLRTGAFIYKLIDPHSLKFFDELTTEQQEQIPKLPRKKCIVANMELIQQHFTFTAQQKKQYFYAIY
tara:strand:- start:8818 stop:9480 length:663 start_codon:yes stop_codon:yes gene_type:complete